MTDDQYPFVTLKKPGIDGGFFGPFPPDIIDLLKEDGYFVDGIVSQSIDIDIAEWQNKTLQLIPPNKRGFKWPGEYERGKGGWVFSIDHIGSYKIPVTSIQGKTINDAKNAVGNYGQNNALLFTDALKTFHVSGGSAFDKMVNKKY